jgi:L-alanine-DL-glutamate epimerase-like enolase superfamily enzyme
VSAVRHAARLELRTTVEALPLRAPFRIAGFTFTEIPVLVVELIEDERRGRGEAAGVYYLDDHPAAMVPALEAHRHAIEAGLSREELRELMPIGGARNALDCALWDLEAKRAGVPAWKLAGFDHVIPLTTTFTLGADDPATMVANARANEDALALKLKLSGALEHDIERVRQVRAARPDVWLGVDANQAFSVDSLRQLLPVLVDARVLLIEQPLPRGQEAGLDSFESPIPLAADESVQGLADIDSLLGRFDVVNIKLDKCGGLTEALMMVEAARRCGLQVMVGNMVGSSLAMAPAFVVGQLCDIIDLDGPTFLVADRAPGVRYRDGTIWCPQEIWG